ncbi:MAG TPA: LuxR C-terminal-related transcriptional regulator [Anaerovoracaceae bacterium]|nr:LuxR C-terminal-related transcriptional regulator [Anaerovoracaceae bacterium]
MRRRSKPKRVYYFPDKLKKQLDQIPNYPLTIVEAPSGFGKTTAVREYLKENVPSDACEYWYTCLGEPAPVSWRNICGLISNANYKIAENLRKLEIPTPDTMMYLISALIDFKCPRETYLVIDNYQLLSSEVPRELISIFSMHGSPNLHMIFITQQLETRQQFTIHNDRIHTIDPSAFFFDKEGTANLFLMEGIRLTNSKLNSVYASTEGWVSAILLQIINFKETGSFDLTADIERLVETAVWNKLSEEEKNFLLSVSILDSFTVRQAAVMADRDSLPENIEELLKTNDFIRYFPDRNIYTIHSILQDYLRNRFYHYMQPDFQNLMLRRAGKTFAAEGQYFSAARYLIKTGDYDAILSLPFDGGYTGNQTENSMPEFIAKLVEEAPEETLRKYPDALLAFCFPMYMSGRFDLYEKLCGLIGSVAETDTAFRPEARRMLKGKLAVIEIFSAYNNIREMHDGCMRALEISGKHPIPYQFDAPFTLGCPSVLFMFWRESGELENDMRHISRTLPDYQKLTQGHGAGAESVMRAEAMLMRGDDNAAEILCHKALYEAHSFRQISVCLCAENVLARIAILRGDVDGYFTAVKNIRGYANENSSLYILRMVDLCLTAISLVLGMKDNVAGWLYDMEYIKKTIYAPAVPFAQVLHSMLLILDKRYNEFLGISELIMAGGTAGNIRYMMPRLCYLKYLAVIKLSSGNEREAQEYCNQALAIALPDKVYLPFANHDGFLDPLLDKAKGSVSDREGLAAINVLCKRQSKGVSVIKKAIQTVKSPLTRRERDVALFAKNRLTAKEIAEELFISEATVKTILKNVYSKLDIHSKSELNTKEF